MSPDIILPQIPQKTLLEILLEKKLLTPAQADVVRKEVEYTARPLEDVIYEKTPVKEKDLTAAKAELYGVPLRSLEEEKIPFEVLGVIPEDAARHYEMAPIDKEGNVLGVGMISPDDVKALEALKFLTMRRGLGLKIYQISRSDFGVVLGQYKSLRGVVKEALEELEKEVTEEKVAPKKKTAEEEAAKIMEEAPITKVVAVILKHAVEGKASDVHIEPSYDRLRVRFRVDGVLYTSLFLPLSIHPAVVSRIKILSNLKIDETRIPQDGRFRTTIEEREIDFRVSTFPTASGEKVALRLLDPTASLKVPTDLGLIGRNLEIMMEGLSSPWGMILITGPTGSGKSTTLYALLNVLNRDEVNIVSLEDPVEYLVKGVNQSQIRPEIGYTFSTGLRHILRQDPDIIMVGEVRDNETAGLAIHASLTGHIVLSSLHTNDAVGIIPRLIDMEVEPFLLPPSLNLMVAQRLIKRLCQDCKKEVTAPKRAEEIIDRELGKLPADLKKNLKWKKPYKIWQIVGCKKCAHKGTKGRVAIFEIFKMSAQLEKIVIEEPTDSRIRAETQRQGMVTLLQDGILKVLDGTISLEEVLQAVKEEEPVIEFVPAAAMKPAEAAKLSIIPEAAALPELAGLE